MAREPRPAPIWASLVSSALTPPTPIVHQGAEVGGGGRATYPPLKSGEDVEHGLGTGSAGGVRAAGLGDLCDLYATRLDGSELLLQGSALLVELAKVGVEMRLEVPPDILDALRLILIEVELFPGLGYGEAVGL